jgi:hypothetical protein
VEFLGRSAVASNPVDLLPFAVEKEEERRSPDAEFPENGFPRLVAAGGPVEDEVFGQKLGERGIVVILLTQQ